MRSSTLIGVALAGVAGMAASANAITILSFTFSDLNGAFAPSSATTGQFSAGSSNSGGLFTNGDVTSLVAPGGSALYGGAGGVAPGIVDIQLSMTNINTGALTADGLGTLTILDADGDILSGTVMGNFFGSPGGGTFFNGALSNVTIVDGGAVDPTWNGPNGGSFDRSLGGAPQPYTGFIINLFVNSTGNFFQTAFSGSSTQASGELVPAPATLAALGFGVMALGRRRR